MRRTRPTGGPGIKRHFEPLPKVESDKTAEAVAAIIAACIRGLCTDEPLDGRPRDDAKEEPTS